MHSGTEPPRDTRPCPVAVASRTAAATAAPAPHHFSDLVRFIAGQPGMVEKLIRRHGNDGTGHCRQCTAGGQTGRNVWPCQLFLAATRVARGHR